MNIPRVRPRKDCSVGRHWTTSRLRLSVYVLVSLLAGASPAVAQEFKSGDITVERPWAPATPKGAEVSAGYFTIRNDGATPERLIGLAADFATVELHEMKTENGVMSMPELKSGLNIPAHGTVRLAPGGYHAMFAHLKHPADERRKDEGSAHVRACSAAHG
jgi:copper(I)-binding protein